MKKIFKTIICFYLYYLIRLAIFIHRPQVIVIAGTTNKTLTKQRIVEKLKQRYTVRTNPSQWNAEIGIPLSILSLNVYKHSLIGWIATCIQALILVFQIHFPETLVLEIGIDRPNDMKYLVKMLSPYIAVITNIEKMYMENFNDDLTILAKEFILLARSLPRNGYLVIEHNNPYFKNLTDATGAKVESYSLTERLESGWYIKNIRVLNSYQEFMIKHNGYTRTVVTEIPGTTVRQAFIVAEIIASIFDIKTDT